ncbi:hypothetical protein L596_019459 [Steinernema carpocapsae]|uniref:Uncharacterized protein n=1 Tax=Steinernema carpocapsae TaxID=34508 RepID=A0A4U5MQN6_STECR|nr:hypothetical protein L596_019459 [Steinernema carpocapsae]
MIPKQTCKFNSKGIHASVVHCPKMVRRRRCRSLEIEIRNLNFGSRSRRDRFELGVVDRRCSAGIRWARQAAGLRTHSHCIGRISIWSTSRSWIGPRMS